MSAEEPSAPTAAATPAPAAAPPATGQADPELDAAAAALARVRSAAAARGRRPNRRGGRPAPGDGGTASGDGRRGSPAGSDTRSGARPDARDPQPVAAVLERMVRERGWTEAVAVGGVTGRWGAVVGADIAEHCIPETFEDGVLVVRTDSTAWATQVRLLVPTLLGRLAEELGPDVVRTVVVRAPAAPSWRKGPRVAPGSKGPGDIYA